jgi:predicted dehydrogenase
VSEVIAGGRLGRITHGRVRLSHDGAVPRDGGQGWLPERFFEPASAVGGALTDLGCHPVYLIQRFLGPTPETISATYRSVTDRKVEDQAVVSVGYPNGAIGVIEASFVGRTPFSIEISGTDGALRYVDDGSGLVVSNRSAGADAVEALPVPADRPDPFDQWVGHIRSNTRADDNLSRAVELTRLVVASNRAARQRRTITYLEG